MAELASARDGNRLTVEFVEAPVDPRAWLLHDATQTNFYSFRAYLEQFDETARTLLAMIWQAAEPGGQPALLRSFAVRIDGRCAVVQSRIFDCPGELLTKLVESLFARYPAVGAVRLECVYADAWRALRSAGQRAVTTGSFDDQVRRLPPSVEAFYGSLEKSFAKRARYYVRRFFREFESASFEMAPAAKVTPELVRKLIDLNRARMIAKKSRSGIDAVYEHRISEVASRHGQIALLKNGAELCAGNILMTAGKDVYLWVVSHDAAYDKFSPGIACLVLALEELIRQGFANYHFLWGASEYKVRLGGVERRLVRGLVLRSWLEFRLAGRDLLRDRAARGAQGAFRIAGLATRATHTAAPLRWLLARMRGARGL